ATGVSGASATIDTKPESLVAAMRLAVEMLKEPAFPDADFERVLEQRIKSLENAPTDPGVRAAQELQRHLNPYSKDDPRYIGLPQEQVAELKKVTLESVKKFHSQFYGASHGELVLIGQFDQETVKKAASELLGNWNSSAPYQRLLSPYKKFEAMSLKIETPDKENAQF